MTNCLTIKTKLFLTISIILACSYAILFFTSVISIQRFTEEEVVKDLEAALKFAKIEFNERPGLLLQTLKLPLLDVSVQQLFVTRDATALKKAAGNWVTSLDKIELFTIVDAQQNVILRSNGRIHPPSFLRGQLLDSLFSRRQPITTIELVPHEQYCREVREEVCWALPEQKDVMVQLVLLPVLDREGNILGAVIAGDDINKNPYLPYLQQQVFGKNVEMLITQMDERIASSSTGTDIRPSVLSEKVVSSLKSGFSFNGTTAFNGREYDMIAEPLHNHKGEFIGSIAVALPKSRFSSVMDDAFRNLLICGLASIAVIFVLAYFTAWQFTLPIRNFLKGVKAIEAGDYEVRLPPTGCQEFKSLVETFNGMAVALSERDSIIVAQNRELLTLNRQLEERVSERLAQHEAEIRNQKTIVNSLQDGLIVTDARQRITQGNQAAERLLGIRIVDVAGEPIGCLSRLPGMGDLQKLLNGAQSATAATAEGATTMIEYERRRLRMTTTPLLDDNGTCQGQLLGIRDITADDEVDRLKSDFVAKMSHELKTPLTSMKGSLQFILKKGKWLTGVEREMLDVCLRNTDRLIGLIASILELSRIESGQTKFSLRPLLIGEVALYALEEIKTAAMQKNISLVNDITVDLPKVYGDYTRLEQVLSNLLSNAVKFSPKNSVVNLSAEVGDGFIAVSVADGGKVIPEEERGALFERFSQGQGAEDVLTSGSGLGLAICKEIMARHGGKIFYAPAASGGNLFTFTVPLYGEQDGSG